MTAMQPLPCEHNAPHGSKQNCMVRDRVSQYTQRLCFGVFWKSFYRVELVKLSFSSRGSKSDAVPASQREIMRTLKIPLDPQSTLVHVNV